MCGACWLNAFRKPSDNSQFVSDRERGERRDWVRRLMPALLLCCLIAVLWPRVALADSLVLAPTHGQPTAALTATYTYGTGANCPVGKVSISFWWNSLNTPIGSVPVSIDSLKNCTAVLKFIPAQVKGAVTSPNKYSVLASPPAAPTPPSATYVIDPPPPPPPSPSPTPSPTPSPSPSPSPSPTPSAAPPPPASTAPRPTPSVAPPPPPPPPPSPSPAAPASPSPALCLVSTTTTPPPSPGGQDFALVVGLVLAGAFPIGAVAFVVSPDSWRRDRRFARLAALLGLGAIVITIGCGRPVSRPTLPTPVQAVQSPTPGCPSPAA